MAERMYCQPIDDGGFPAVLPGNDERFELLIPRMFGDRQYTPDRMNTAIKAKLSRHHIISQYLRARDLSGRTQDAQRDGQIERASCFLNIRRCKIDHQLSAGHVIAAVFDSALDTLYAFFYRTVRKPDQEGMQACRYIHFDGNGDRSHPAYRAAKRLH